MFGRIYRDSIWTLLCGKHSNTASISFNVLALFKFIFSPLWFFLKFKCICRICFDQIDPSSQLQFFPYLPFNLTCSFLFTFSDIHTEEETMEIISFTIVSQHSKYIGINPIQKMEELHSENFKILKKKRQKTIPNHVKNFHAHGLAGLISWKWSSYPRQSTDSVQFSLKFWEAVFYRNWKKKKNLKFCMETQKTQSY